MDPLSISMAILTIIGATKATIKAAHSVYNAPEELESLLNDLTEGEIMVLDVKYHLGEPKQELTSPERTLQERLGEAECVLLDLKNLVQTSLLKKQDSTSMRRYAWFKAKKKTRKLRDKLAKIHEELPRRLGQMESSRIKLELSNISLVQSEMHSGLSRIENKVDATSEFISNLIEAHHKNAEALCSTQQLPHYIDSSTRETHMGTLYHLARPDAAFSASSNLQICSEIARFQQRRRPIPPERTIPMEYRAITAVELPPIMQSTYHSLMVQTQYRQPNLCDLTCRCRCHTERTVGTPSLLAGLVGQIFIGYKGIPAIAKSCMGHKCQQNSEPHITAVYFFPRWWVLDRIMFLTARRMANIGPKISLSFPRLITPNSLTFLFVNTGAVESLKLLFVEGRASPIDMLVLDDYKSSIAHLALHFGQYPTLKFLIQVGADLDVENADGSVIADLACRKLFEGKVPKQHQRWVMETFMPKLPELGFSNLHEAILGHQDTNIEEEISKLRSAAAHIDLQDAWGFAPLHWACARGDKDAAVRLLEFGANPNIINKFKQSPLHLALTSGHLECAFTLLSHKADARYIANERRTAFTTAAQYCGNHESILDFFETLHKLGADINAKLASGFTSLLLVVSLNLNRPLRWLLDHGADYRISNLHGATILHYLGFYADLRMIEIIRQSRLSGIDVNAKDHALNFTPMEWMLDPNRYPLASRELLASFAQLLEEIEAHSSGQAPSDRSMHHENVGLVQMMEQVSEKFVDGAEDEEQTFQDSVEFQTEDAETISDDPTLEGSIRASEMAHC